MSERHKGGDRSGSHADIRRRAASISTGQGIGQGAASRGRSRVPFFPDSGHAILLEQAAEVVEWLTKPLSSSSVSYAQSSLNLSVAAEAPCYTLSSTATVAVAPLIGTEESAKLFKHSISHLL